MNRIIKILDKDLSDAYDAISRDTSVTWYKPLYTFENGDKLCLAASMMDFDGDGYDGYMKLAILPKNAGMSEYDMDFVMPYNPVTGDVYDTESGFVEHYSADDVNYWNEQARSIVDMLERGELVASSRKVGKKKPIQSMARGYLKPEYDSSASFYNKAEFDDDKLYSYGTLVAEIVDGKPVLYPDWDYSQTTIRHVREFLRQHGFTADSKAQIAKDYLANSRKPVKSSFAGFDDFDSFASYAEAHYLPILDKVSEEGYQITRDDARLLAFLHDDLVSLVNNGFDL